MLRIILSLSYFYTGSPLNYKKYSTCCICLHHAFHLWFWFGAVLVATWVFSSISLEQRGYGYWSTCTLPPRAFTTIMPTYAFSCGYPATIDCLRPSARNAGLRLPICKQLTFIPFYPGIVLHFPSWLHPVLTIHMFTKLYQQHRNTTKVHCFPAEQGSRIWAFIVT